MFSNCTRLYWQSLCCFRLIFNVLFNHCSLKYNCLVSISIHTSLCCFIQVKSDIFYVRMSVAKKIINLFLLLYARYAIQQSTQNATPPQRYQMEHRRNKVKIDTLKGALATILTKKLYALEIGK